MTIQIFSYSDIFFKLLSTGSLIEISTIFIAMYTMYCFFIYHIYCYVHYVLFSLIRSLLPFIRLVM